MDEPRPSLRSLRSAVREVAAAGQEFFTARQLFAHSAERGDGWSYETLRELLTREARTSGGCVTRVRVGVYRLRQPDDAGACATRAADAVLGALRTLADSGCAAATRREVTATVRAAGVPYSERSVSAALLELQHRLPPAVRPCPGHRYALCTGEEDGIHARRAG
ncbi:MAG TPA: hypothetical protein VHO01_13745 [Jatrophihabitans sp.]|nr:hypothetical protein [Jatrophihabitans sp.]